MLYTKGSELVRCYTYGYGSGTSSVVMDPYTFDTRKMTNKMEYIATKLHGILLQNKKCLNLQSADLNQKFNHYIVIMYYAVANLKQNSSLGMHYDCIYSPTDGSFATKANAQVKNTPAVVYLIGGYQSIKLEKNGIL